MHAQKIAVVAFDGISPYHLSLPCLVFGNHRADLGVAPYDFMVCSAEDGKLRTSGGFTIETVHDLGVLSSADIVIVPSWRNPHEPAPVSLIEALRAAHARGAQVVGLCLGVFVVAEAGLLEGRRATTHWLWARLFTERFSNVRLEVDKLYIDEGDVLTSAGNAAGMDCCLHLFRKHHGADVANRLARRLVVQPHRPGGQAQFIERPMQHDGAGDRLSITLAWARANLSTPHTIRSLADHARLGERTFSRRFQQLTGTSVKRWLTEERLLLAQCLLESSNKPVNDIAHTAGFTDSLSMRQQFAAKLNTTPSMYRKVFRMSEGNRV